jgi:hypothetical protein
MQALAILLVVAARVGSAYGGMGKSAHNLGFALRILSKK